MAQVSTNLFDDLIPTPVTQTPQAGVGNLFDDILPNQPSQPSFLSRARQFARPFFLPADVVREGVGGLVTADLERAGQVLGATPVGALLAPPRGPVSAAVRTIPRLAGQLAGEATSLPLDPSAFAFGAASRIPSRLARTATGAALGGTTGVVRAPEGAEPVAAGLGAGLGALVGLPRVRGGVRSRTAFFSPRREEPVALGSRLERIQTQFTDRFAPVKHLIDLFEKTVGRKALPAENTFQAARLYAGIPGRINARAEQLGDLLRPVANQADDLSRVLVAERNAELAAQGRGLAKGAKVRLKSGKTVPAADLAGLEAELGTQQVANLRRIAQQITEFNNRVLLEDALQAGLISPEVAAASRARNARYVPFEVLEEIADALLPEGVARTQRLSFEVAQQRLFQRLAGGAQGLEDPLIAQMRRVFKITTLAEKNRVTQTMAAIAQTPEGAQVVRRVGPDDLLPPGWDTMQYLERGIKQTLAVPQPVADALKGLTQEAMDFMTRWASLGSRALRAGATTFSAGFALTNPLRDFQLAKLVSRQMGVPFNVRLWLRGLADAMPLTRGGRDLVREFEESLGSFGGFFRGAGGVSAGRSPAQALRAVAPTTRQRLTKIATTAVNPAAWIQKVGELGEMAPRLAVYRSALRQGRPRAEAAFAARNATIDFSRMGTSMKIANLWVPFLNARVQGTLNTFGAVRGKPLGSAYVLTTMIGMPLLATYYWNTRRFPEVWADIPQWEKDNNFLLLLGDAQDAQGRYTQAIKIPKGDVGRMAGNPLENLLTFIDQREPQALGTVMLKTFSDLSPVEFEREGRFSASRALGGVTPPTVEAMRVLSDVEARNRFTGFPVVPRRLQEVSPELRATARTSPTLRALATTRLGRALRVSPVQTEAAIGTQFGTAGRQLLALADRLAFGSQAAPGRVTGPVVRRFVGVSGGGTEEQLIDRAIALRQHGLDQRERERLEAEALLKELRANPTNPTRRDELLRLAQRRNPRIVHRMREAAQDEQRGVTTLDRILRTMSVESRAQFIQERLARMTPQDQQAWLKDLRRKGLLSVQVNAQLRRQLARRP